MPVARYLQNVSFDPRITPEVLSAVSATESSNNPNAVGPITKYGTSAQGQFQLMPGTAQDLGVDPFNPSEALAGAKKYLSYLLKQTGNLPDALASYNMGLSAFKKRGPNLPRETQDYVKKVMQLMGQKDAGQPPSVAAAPLNAGDPTPEQNPPDAAPSSPPSAPQIGDGSGVGVGAMPKFSGYGKIPSPPSQFTGSANPIAMVETLLRNPLALSQGTPMAAGGFVKLPSHKHVPSKAFGFKRMQSSVAGPSVSDSDDGGGMASGGLVKRLLSNLYKEAGPEVSGMVVRKETPNLSSIGSALDNYETLPGVREVPMSYFAEKNAEGVRGYPPLSKQYSVQRADRVKQLADQINASGELNPLIVAHGKNGPYIVEGSHRFDALKSLGVDSFPAVVVRDIGGPTPSPPITKAVTSSDSPLGFLSGEAPPESEYYKLQQQWWDDVNSGGPAKDKTFAQWYRDQKGISGYAEGGAVIRSAPRGKVLGALSDAARYIDENALQPIQHGLERIPVGFTGTAGDYTSGRSSGLLGLLAPRFNSLADVLNEASYGMPLTTGGGMTTGLKPEVGFAALDASQLNNLRPLVKGAKSLGKKVASRLDRPDVIESMFGPEDEWNAAKANWDAAQGYAGGGAVRGALGRIAARLGADELPNAIKPLEAVKEQGGQWLPGSAKAFTEAITRSGSPQEIAQGMPIELTPAQSWAEKAIPRYVEKYMGSKGDPLASAKIPVGEGFKSWEEITDPLIASRPVNELPNWVKQENPWLGKLPENTPIHNVYRASAAGDYISHVLDHAATIPPEKLKNYDFPRLVQEVQKIDADRAAKMNSVEGRLEGTVPHKQYPSGYQWVEVQSPDALKNEGDIMGHCVGGYCDAVKSGQTKIYSLRSPTGESHVTVEARKSDPSLNVEAIKAGIGPEEFSRLKSLQGNQDTFLDVLNREIPNWRNQVNTPIGIAQIKGKQNLAPKPEYQPYVQDFIRSGDWGDVRDLENSGLQKTKDLGQHAYKNGQLYTQEEVSQLQDKYGKYMTADEMDDYLRSLGNPQTQMKKGGSIKKCKGGGSCKCLGCLRKRLK